MPTRWHNSINKAITEFGRSRKKFKDVHGSGRPLHIPHPTKKKTHLYRPDAHFITKFGRVWIFEILDSEMNDDNLIISDIILASLCPNVAKIFFIVKDEEYQDRVRDLFLIIQDNMADKGIPKKELAETYAFFIYESEANSSIKLMKILKDNIY